MAVATNSLLRNLYILDNENDLTGAASSTVYPSTILDQVFDPETVENKNLRTILAELRQEIITGGVGGINFPVESVNGMHGDVVITKDIIGLGQVDNTADKEKPLSVPQREAVQEMLDTHEFTVDLTDLYDHLENSNNPHHVTFEQLNIDGSLDDIVEGLVSTHDADSVAHPDIREDIRNLENELQNHEDNLNEQYDALVKMIEAHCYDLGAHIDIMKTKENKINKVRTFSEVNDVLYPTTSAVVDYVDARLNRFNDEEVSVLPRLKDIRVVDSITKLPEPTAETVGLVYLITNEFGIVNRMSVCKSNPDGYTYGWNTTTLTAVDSYDKNVFELHGTTLSMNLGLIAKEVVDNEEVSQHLLDKLDQAVKESLGEYVTVEEFEKHGYLKNVRIETGTQSGTIKYTTVTTAGTETSEDIKVADINKLAFMDKVTSDYIEDEAVDHYHIANRAIHHRHLDDQVVAAHNMRAKYMHVFGNFEDKEGLTVREVPMDFFVKFLEEAFYGWLENGEIMDWFKERVHDMVKYEIHSMKDWIDPAAIARIYMNDRGELIEEVDYDEELTQGHTTPEGNLVFNDDDEKQSYKDLSRYTFAMVDSDEDPSENESLRKRVTFNERRAL